MDHPSSRRDQESNITDSTTDTYSVSRSLGRLDCQGIRPLPGLIAADATHLFGEHGRSVVTDIERLAEQVLAQFGIPPLQPIEMLSCDVQDTMDMAFDEGVFEPKQASVVLRGYADDQASMRPTLLIVADWKGKDDHWIASAWELATYELDAALFQATHNFGLNFDINIEFIATHLLRPAHASPVVGQPDLEIAWNGHILPQLTRIAYSQPEICKHVNVISLARIGHAEPYENPLTVYIALSTDCNEKHWLDLAYALKQYLSTLRYHFELRLEHNSLTLSAFYPQPAGNLETWTGDKTPYQKQASLGADISFSGYVNPNDPTRFSPTVGTLGCYVELKFEGENEGEHTWKRLALTNYHNIRPLFQGFRLRVNKDGKGAPTDPSPGTILYSVDRQGIRPKMAQSLGNLEHPSRHRHHCIVTILEKHIRIEQDLEELKMLKNQLDEKKSFFDKDGQVLGKLFAASGFARRTASNRRRLDWALVDVAPERQGSNTLPSPSVWSEHKRIGDAPEATAAYGTLKNPHRGTQLDESEAKTGMVVWKMGAASGPTKGVLSGFRVHCGITEARYVDSGGETEEFQFFPAGVRDEQLGIPGDSGSIVYAEDGSVVGLLFRGLPPGLAGVEFTLVTPIGEVFQDILHFTGATEVRIA